MLRPLLYSLIQRKTLNHFLLLRRYYPTTHFYELNVDAKLHWNFTIVKKNYTLLCQYSFVVLYIIFRRKKTEYIWRYLNAGGFYQPRREIEFHARDRENILTEMSMWEEITMTMLGAIVSTIHECYRIASTWTSSFLPLSFKEVKCPSSLPIVTHVTWVE